jgi:uncharacterized protein (TIGR02453 family)
MARGEQPILRAGIERNLSQKSASDYFSRELFRFLADLKRNNNRDWFAKNKGRYEKALLQPSIRFIRDARKALKTISPYMVADPKPFGGSLFRIYRDIRFSKDKSPYKTNVAMDFWHQKAGKSHSSPALYLHISPGISFVASGVWHPETPILNKIRKAILERPDSWKKVLEAVSFTNKQITSPTFIDEFIKTGKSMDPLNQFLVQSNGPPW